ncbi:MAG: DUF1573 domain-containing protein [Bacteroidetes bacterium]|jgi:hypothetical protein|nr:DUF1573 domain-containing protein [Flavobacteriaceae bacterium]MDA0719667.1 DUF1573 domain-containing protein [Bacteroidota bacterium]MDA0863283.1 DUF1573 domain-containing protein [Bacteroidota bacterium]HCK04807.1 hypothetical protein [Flavobacteriaceae bacterium]
MKKTLFLAVLVAFGMTSCKDNAAEKVSADNVAAAAERDTQADKYPVMSFTETTYDFGTINQGEAQEHVFTFTNTGEADLVIVDAKSSCGCTVPQYPKTPIAPGETGEMLVKFNGSGKNQVSKTVTVTANTQKGKEMISIKAFVTPKDGAVEGSPIKVQ